MKRIILPLVVDAVLIGAAYYVALPALNIHSIGFWMFVVLALAVIGLSLLIAGAGQQAMPRMGPGNTIVFDTFKKAGGQRLNLRLARGFWVAAGVLFVLMLLLDLYSSPVFHAKAYASAGAQRMTVGDFQNDIAVVENGEITDIAIMDTTTAATLGSRQIGSLGTLATQYELGAFMTTTINGQIAKVAPLGYGDFWKWVNRRSAGVPGYVRVDPVVGTSEYVEFDEPIHYSDTGLFGDNVTRRIRFAYPGTVFYNVHFEVDNSGHPYWVAIVNSYQVGLFGCEVPNGVITCDAVSGVCVKYTAEEIPDWVSIAYSGDDLVRLVNYAGTYGNGYINTLFAKEGVYSCTDDYGYKVVGENLNAFTGITSAASDESNIGFVLCDEHTGQIIRYDIFGAEEYSAESAAQGVVMNYGYRASFPSIVNVGGRPVYIMALTDAGNLIKKYAMVDLQDYNNVVAEDTVYATWASFVNTYLGGNEHPSQEGDSTAFAAYEVELDGLYREPVLATVAGESCFYLAAKGGTVYVVPLAGNESLLYATARSRYTLRVVAEPASGPKQAELVSVSMEADGAAAQE